MLGHETYVSMRKDLVCNTGHRVNLPFPPLPGQIYIILLLKAGNPLHLSSSSARLKLPLPRLPAHIPSHTWKQTIAVLQKESRHASAPTQAGSSQQRTCDILSLSSQLPV